MLPPGKLLAVVSALAIAFAACKDASVPKLSLGVVVCRKVPFNVHIQESLLIGNLFGTAIYKVDKVVLEPLSDKKVDLVKTVHRKAIVQSFLSAAGFYYSNCEPEKACYQLWKSAVHNHQEDDREDTAKRYFVANEHMLGNIEIHSLPPDTKSVDAIRGFVGMGCTQVGEQLIGSALISRTSSHRTGPRLHSRGADDQGNVSNFVEIETLIANKTKVASFVQVRGSLPFKWSQLPAWSTYFVPVHIPKHEENDTEDVNQGIFDKHVQLLKSLYKSMTKLTMVSLIDEEGKYVMENQLAKELKRVAGGHGKDETWGPHLVPFEYRAAEKGATDEDCKPLQEYTTFRPAPWFCKLMTKIDARTLDHSVINDGKVQNRQTQVVRTSCLSTLDRTSAAQKSLSDFVSIRMLESVDQSSKDKSFPAGLFDWMIRGWVEVANCISQQYAGTPAKKADVLTGGKSSFLGTLYDNTIMSMKRHVNANYSDRWKVKAMADIFGKDAADMEVALGRKAKVSRS